MTPDSEVMEISKYLEHNSFFPPNATQFKHMNGCVINWLWSNNRRSENNSGSWWQSEKNLHINMLELVTVSIEIKHFKLCNLCLLLETDENTRFAINQWRSPCVNILNVLTTFQEMCLQMHDLFFSSVFLDKALDRLLSSTDS